MTNARVQGDLVKNYRYAKMAKMKLCISLSLPKCLTFWQVNHPVKHFHVNSNFWLKDKSRRETLNAGDVKKENVFTENFRKNKEIWKFIFQKRRFE